MREPLIAVLVWTVACAAETTPRREAEVVEAVTPEAEAARDLPRALRREPKPRETPPGFVVLPEAVPGVVLDVRYATADNFTGAPLPGYVAGTLWVHRSTADALARVQTSLTEVGLGLRVYDAYRPGRASDAMVAWAKASGRETLLREGYVARRSNHARGNTVDVTLQSAGGEVLDMGTAWDSFSTDSHYAAARGDAMLHRSTLRRAMTRAGFKPYAREWWHFTLPEPAGLPRLDIPYTGH